ncbi:putative ABC-type xenobiotic transporter [Helianthus annuus]|uniref:ABC-type xenobiotic transporter n=1 Tax=Helianthus annuus TaxID=4232 RepID=A0A251TDE9_HELAN|nr:putative ABC-type xenobiotic transporter [Helianthus annuus]KAJ0519218.1 putative ABC-type xenobiotic transporter [Helianthus annuus]KAJ0687210.1 putative ABC-type xenobiotic transporter [Helianthus annuus]KAJ0877080.1 putative ABC-type xenobiotic transporter [Helianthus annuus]
MEWFYNPTLGTCFIKPIRDNTVYGRDATLLQIEDAAKIAHAHTFITTVEKGYDTQVGRVGLSLTEEK